MKALEDAWNWYSKSQRLLRLMGRLGRRYWQELPPSVIEKDVHFRNVEGADLEGDSVAVLSEFNDIAIFVLFSVFESIVRDRVWEDLKAEVDSLMPPALIRSAAMLRQSIQEGSFYNNVLTLYKNVDHI